VQVKASANDEILKPFVLASKGPGDFENKIEVTKAALIANGFAVVGAYFPYPDAEVIVVTNDELKSNAAKSEHGGFGAIQRISVTNVKIDNEIQVSYTNPVYMANVYRMHDNLKGVRAKTEKSVRQSAGLWRAGNDCRQVAQISLHGWHGRIRRAQFAGKLR